MSTIKSIRNRRELEIALSRIDGLWSARPGHADWEERQALVAMVEAFEEQHVHLSLPDPVDAILFRMEQGGLRAKDLIPFIGPAPRVSEVLHRKRALTKEMIRQLHIGLGIPLASLLGVPPEPGDVEARTAYPLPCSDRWFERIELAPSWTIPEVSPSSIAAYTCSASHGADFTVDASTPSATLVMRATSGRKAA